MRQTVPRLFLFLPVGLSPHPLTDVSVWVSSPVPSPVSSTYSRYWNIRIALPRYCLDSGSSVRCDPGYASRPGPRGTAFPVPRVRSRAPLAWLCSSPWTTPTQVNSTLPLFFYHPCWPRATPRTLEGCVDTGCECPMLNTGACPALSEASSSALWQHDWCDAV